MKNVIGAGYTTQKVGTSVGTHGAVALTVAFPTAHTHTHTHTLVAVYTHQRTDRGQTRSIGNAEQEQSSRAATHGAGVRPKGWSAYIVWILSRYRNE
jgi:hypothetical protein